MKKKPVTFDHFKHFINLSGLKERQGGLLFTASKVSEDESGYCHDLCLLDTDTDRIRTILENISAGEYHWAADGSVLFTAVMDEEEKKLQDMGAPVTALYRLNPESGACEKVLAVNKEVSDFREIGEGAYAFLCDDFLADDMLWERAGGDAEIFARLKKEEEDYFIAEEVPYWYNGIGYCNGRRGRVFIRRGGALSQITPDNLHVTAMDAFEDKYILYCGQASGGVQSTTGKLYLYDIPSGNTVALDESEDYVYTAVKALSADEILLCRNDRRLHGEYQNEFIDIVSLKDGGCRRVNEKADYHIYDSVVTDMFYKSSGQSKVVRAENGTYFLATRRESSRVYFWRDGQAQPETVSTAAGKTVDYAVCGGFLYFIAARGCGGTELYKQSLSGGEEICLSGYNTALQDIYDYSRPQELLYRNEESVTIQGWYMKPAGFEEGKKYPAILFIHGGPQVAYGQTLNHDMQLMAARGYGIIYCNPTGSEGRGGDFSDIRTRYGTIDAADLTGFTNYAADCLPWIDRQRLGITGGSYGGIMTSWIIGHCDLFRAAVSDRGSCNNISDFGLSDISVSFCLDTYETTPWEDAAALWDASPLKYAPDIKTPVLWIHGVNDYRCTFDSALQMHSALTYFGTPSKVVGFKGENHSLSRTGKPKHRIRRLEEMAAWFDRYLKEETNI